MAKKFSIVNIEEQEIFITGFIEPIDLSESEEFLDIMMEIDPEELVPIEIEHCQMLDFGGEDDLTLEELDYVLENFDDLVSRDRIFCKDSIEFEMNGLYEEDDEEEVFIET